MSDTTGLPVFADLVVAFGARRAVGCLRFPRTDLDGALFRPAGLRFVPMRLLTGRLADFLFLAFVRLAIASFRRHPCLPASRMVPRQAGTAVSLVVPARCSVRLLWMRGVVRDGVLQLAVAYHRPKERVGQIGLASSQQVRQLLRSQMVPATKAND